MERTRIADFKCPAARALDSVGDWWSILIIRDAFQGLSRFDDFQNSLGIAPNILTRRLKHLMSEGLFEKRLYCERPARFEYILTSKGRDFFPVLVTLFAWGNRHLPSDEVAMVLGDRETGKERRVVVVDETNGRTVEPDNTILLAGPAADELTFSRIALVRRIRNAGINSQRI